MSLSRKTAAIVFTVLYLVSLALLNHDIFRFEYHDPFTRSFSPEENEKGFFFLGDPVFLKPGNYTLTLSGSLPGSGSEAAILGSDEEVLYSGEFSGNGEEEQIRFSISGKAQNVRVRLNYDPRSGTVRIDHFKIHSDHVLYKESVIRHAVVSFILTLIFLCGLMRILKPDTFFRIFPCFRDSRDEKSLGILLVLTVLVCAPLLQPGTYIEGADTMFHLSRLSGVAADLKAGIFPPRIELFWLDGIGYGIGFFYSEIFLVIPALFLLLGFSVLTVHKTLWFLIVFLTLLSHFWTAKLISCRSRKAGISAAVFIALAIYRIQNQYNRDGLGEAFAFIFLPMIAAGLFLIFRKKADGWKILAIGFSGTLLSHSISFVLAVLITAVFLVTRIRRCLKEPEIITAILKAALFSIGLTAFFLLPMLEQKFAVPGLKINQVTSGKLDMAYATTTQTLGNVLLFFQPDTAPERIYFYPGWPLLGVLLLGIYLRLRGEKGLKAANIMCISAAVILLVSTDIFPWHLFQFFLNNIQFTWRFVQSAVILLSLSGGIYVSRLCARFTPVRILLIQTGLCLIPAVLSILSIRGNRLKPSDGFFLQTHHTYGSEYMPPDLSRKYIKENISVITDNTGRASFGELSRDGLSLHFSYRTAMNKIDFTVPFLYYKGYTAEISSSESTKHNVSASAAENGFVRVTGTGPDEGTMLVRYAGTAIQTVSNIITLLTLAGWFVLKFKKTVIGYNKKVRI